MSQRFAHIFFIDGVGMGANDSEINPFVTANLPALTGLFGEGWYLADGGRRTNKRASLVPTDACLRVEGRPQSATGQAVILTGRNVSAAIGEHYVTRFYAEASLASSSGGICQRVLQS